MVHQVQTISALGWGVDCTYPPCMSNINLTAENLISRHTISTRITPEQRTKHRSKATHYTVILYTYYNTDRYSKSPTQLPKQAHNLAFTNSPPSSLPHRHSQRHRCRLMPLCNYAPGLPNLTLAARPAEPASKSLVLHQRPRVAVQVRVEILPYRV